MPRRTAPMASTTTSKTTPSKPHKRQLSSSATQTTGSTPGSRQSKRIRASAENTSKTNGARSKYFKGSNSDSDGENKPAKSSQVSGEDSSDYEDEDDYDSEDALKKSRVKGKQAGRSSSATTTTTTGGLIEKGKELWRQGVKAGLGPGKAVFIEKPKPRGDGGIKYVPGKIHPNTMAFLADLKVNNEREWMKSELSFLVLQKISIHIGNVGFYWESF